MVSVFFPRSRQFSIHRKFFFKRKEYTSHAVPYKFPKGYGDAAIRNPFCAVLLRLYIVIKYLLKLKNAPDIAIKDRY